MTKELHHEIKLTPLALEMFEEIKDQRHLQIISKCIDKLKISPEKQGKPLTDILKGYRSVRGFHPLDLSL